MPEENEKDPYHSPLLGFGDARGFYDFDSMSVEYNELRTEVEWPEAIYELALTKHETNHWFQQITTSFGNYSTLIRAAQLNFSQIFWESLKKQIKEDVLDGVLKAPLAKILTQGEVDEDLLALFDENNSTFNQMTEEASKLGVDHKKLADFNENNFNLDQHAKTLQLLNHGHAALQSTDWIRNGDIETIENKIDGMLVTFGFVIMQQKLRGGIESDFEEIFSDFKDYSLHHIKLLSDDNIISRFQLFDVKWILEASCVVQEIAFTEKLYAIDKSPVLREFTESRFTEITHTAYAGPIKYVLNKLQFDWSIDSIAKSAGLIAQIVEVALNPPIPPRIKSPVKHLGLFQIHPSIRFAAIVERLKDMGSDLSLFDKFSSIPYANKQSMINQYLAGCSFIAERSELHFDHRLELDYIYGEDTFNAALQSVKSRLDGQGDLEDTMPGIHFVLDSGYNSIFLGGAYLQNSIMLCPSYKMHSLAIQQDADAFRKSDFSDFLYMGVLSETLQTSYKVKKGHFPNVFLGKYAFNIIADQHVAVAQFYLMFTDAIDFKVTNFPEETYSENLKDYYKDLVRRRLK